MKLFRQCLDLEAKPQFGTLYLKRLQIRTISGVRNENSKKREKKRKNLKSCFDLRKRNESKIGRIRQDFKLELS